MLDALYLVFGEALGATAWIGASGTKFPVLGQSEHFR